MLPHNSVTVSLADVSSAPHACGIYELVTITGIALKVGIATSLRRRLVAHARSRQSRLRLRLNGSWDNPSDVMSKQSVLTKHLYFDAKIAPEYVLTSEDGRQRFLREQCLARFVATASRDEARHLECLLEATGRYRYCGRVRVRTG